MHLSSETKRWRSQRLIKGSVLFALLSATLAAQVSVPQSVQTVLTAANASSSVTQYMVALPHIAYGGPWRTQIYITNSSSVAASVELYYYGDDGNPISIPFNGVEATSSTLTVPANGQTVIEPDYSASSSVGAWAGIVYSNSGIKVQGVFLWHRSGDPADEFTQAAAPVISQLPAACIIPLPTAAISYTLPFDETGGRFSGYGFANTTNVAATLNATFYDQSGTLVGQYTEQLNPFGHDAFLIRDRIPAAEAGGGKKGVMVLTGAGIVPLGFLFTPYNAFATWLP